MKSFKKILSVLIVVALIACCFAGCSSKNNEKYSDTVAIIGYTEEVEPFIYSVNDGNADGFIPDLWSNIFDSVKGDLKSYRFEKIDSDYILEEDGGFVDGSGKEYSACLLMGAVRKNDGTFNQDYSYSEPIITDRVITVTKDGKVKNYADFSGKKIALASSAARSAFEKNETIYNACASVTQFDDVNDAVAKLDSGEVDAVVTDEFSYSPLTRDGDTVLDGELDKIEYVIACAKNSGWKDSINDAIYEMKSESYGDGDTFTPLVEKYFGYNASSFSYEPETDKKK